MGSSYFLIRYPIFALGLAIVILMLQRYWGWILMPNIWVFYLFYLLMIPGIYFLAIWGSRQQGGSSVVILLLTELIKMIFPLILASLVIFKVHPPTRIFGFNFFILYILFSSFEIHCLLHNLRLQKKYKKPEQNADKANIEV